MATPAPYADWNAHRWPPGRIMAHHSHDFPQLIHILSGHLEVDFGRGWVDLHPGDCHLLPAGRSHALRTTVGHRQFGLNLRPGDDTRGVAAALAAHYPDPCVIHAPIPRGLQAELVAPYVGLGEERLRRGMILDRYVALLVEAGTETGDGSLEQRLLDHLHRHRDRQLAVEGAALALGTSRTSLQRLCKQRFGCGFGQLHERVRMSYAADLVVTGDDPIGVLAERLGYGDLPRFSRAFRRFHGRSPSAYRERHARRAL